MDVLHDPDYIDLDEHTPEAVAVITRHFHETHLLPIHVAWDTNRNGNMTDVYDDLNAVPGGRDLAWAIWSALEEWPR